MRKSILLFILFPLIFSIASCGNKKEDPTDKLVAQLGSQETYPSAVKALRDMGPDAIPALVKGLKNPDAKIREESARTLAFIGPDAKDAVPALIETLKDTEPLVRSDSAWALGEIGSAAHPAIPALIAAMDDEEDTVRDFAIQAVGAFGPAAADALPKLRDIAKNDANAFLRDSALEAIDAIEAPPESTGELKEGNPEPMD